MTRRCSSLNCRPSLDTFVTVVVAVVAAVVVGVVVAAAVVDGVVVERG